LRDLQGMVANLALHGHTPIPMAAQTTPSMARDFFESGPFADHMKGLENTRKTTEALFSSIANVVKAIVSLGKVMAGRR
jgi:hypothetical protein